MGSTVLAKRLANQLCYGNKTEGEKNEFYGYSGMGYGGEPEGPQVFIPWKEYTEPLWVVPHSQPRVKVWLVEEEPKKGEELAPEETLRSGAVNEKIQLGFDTVPLPLLAQIPRGQIQAAGTDAQAIIWCPSTDELWEIHRLGIFKQGPHIGTWKFGYGHYQAEASKWNGVTATESGELSASGLSIAHNMITLGDLVRIQRGEKLGHAIAIAVRARANEYLAPARTNDFGENTHKFLPSPPFPAETPNPAYGNVDAVPEGLWCRFPPTSRASEHGMTRKLEIALYEAIREHGVVLRDGGIELGFADLRTLYTPYCDTKVDAITTTAAKFATYARENVTEAVWQGWQDPTLTGLEGELNGVAGALAKMPWRTLEQLEPRSS